MIIRFLRRAIVVAATAALTVTVVGPATAAAQNDDSVLLHYTLTAPKVDAWGKASMELARALKGRQAEQKQMEQRVSKANTIDDMVEEYDKIPEARRAMRAARISTREYVTVGLVIAQAMMADEVFQENPKAERPKNLNPSNLTFVREHRQELQRRIEEMQKLAGTEG